MARRSKYPREVRERAVRMVFEHREQYASQWEAICSIAEKIGCSAESLRKWIRRTEIDAGPLVSELDPVLRKGLFLSRLLPPLPNAEIEPPILEAKDRIEPGP